MAMKSIQATRRVEPQTDKMCATLDPANAEAARTHGEELIAQLSKAFQAG